MNVEQKVPTKLYVLGLLLGGIQGNMLFAFYNIVTENQTALAVGFSSAICAGIGIIVADMLIQSILRGNLKVGLYRILFVVGYVIIMSLLPGVDIWGHIGGLFSGFLITMSFISCWDKEEIRKVTIFSTMKVKKLKSPFQRGH